MSAHEKRLSENTAERLLSMIGHGKKYQADDKLPNEIQLARELEVSRSTLREAIRMLSAGGVLETRRGVGTFVTNQPSPDYAELQDFVKSTASPYDAFEMRLMFEPRCAYLAAERASEEELDLIIESGEALLKKLNIGESGPEEDQTFHENIASATHNAYISDLLPIVFQGIKQSIQLMGKDRQFIKNTMDDTRLIMDFLRNRNAEGASTAMKLHILHAIQYFDK